MNGHLRRWYLGVEDEGLLDRNDKLVDDLNKARIFNTRAAASNARNLRRHDRKFKGLRIDIVRIDYAAVDAEVLK